MNIDDIELDLRLDLDDVMEARLTPRQRQVFCLCVTHELEAKQAAKLLGLASHSSVLRSLEAACKTIRACLDEEEPSEKLATAGSSRVQPVCLTPRLRTWIVSVGSGNISPLRIMTGATMKDLQSWLAGNGDQKMSEALDRQARGWKFEYTYESKFALATRNIAGARRSEYTYYVTDSVKTNLGKTYELTPEDQMRRRGRGKHGWVMLFGELTDDQVKNSRIIA